MKQASRPRLADIAAAAGVSIATASRALAQPGIVNAATLKRVRLAALRLGGPAALRERGMGGGIAVIVPTLDNPIFSRALQAMQAVLAEAGQALLVASSDYQPEAEVAAIRVLLARGVDGLILVGAQRPPEAWALLEASGVPVVLTWCGDPRFDAVVVDNHAAGRLAAEHLLDLGHRRLGLVCGVIRSNDRQRARMAGVRAALAARGLDLPDWRVVEQDFTLAGGRSGCSALLSLAEPPSAIICGIDLLAVGCMVEAQSRGLRVPGEISIVGIDNLEMAAHLSPALTTVHIPTARIGSETAQLMLARLAGTPARLAGTPARLAGTPARQMTALPIELVVRQSSGPA